MHAYSLEEDDFLINAYKINFNLNCFYFERESPASILLALVGETQWLT